MPGLNGQLPPNGIDADVTPPANAAVEPVATNVSAPVSRTVSLETYTCQKAVAPPVSAPELVIAKLPARAPPAIVAPPFAGVSVV